MTRDYRQFLRAIGRKRVDADKLRTTKADGTLEIVRERGAEHLHRYGALLED